MNMRDFLLFTERVDTYLKDNKVGGKMIIELDMVVPLQSIESKRLIKALRSIAIVDDIREDVRLRFQMKGGNNAKGN